MARGRQDATQPGAAGRWMPQKPARRPGRGRRRRSMLIELTRGKHAIVDVNDADLVRS
jgi:hypothetical protein